MDSDQGNLFLRGKSWETSEENLKDYFGRYGEVLQTVIMRDKTTRRPRGFGFVVFADPSILDRVLHDKHTIDGRTVEAKRAMSREEQQISSRYGNPNSGRSVPGGANINAKKIFVGGLPATLTEEKFRSYFENYGHVTDAIIIYDQNTQRSRGFGFISFDTEDAVDRVLHKSYYDLNGKPVEVKRALPKDANPGSAGCSTGGGGYHGYGGSGCSAASNAVGFGGYGVASYGGASAGYGGPAGAYGNAPGVGYASGPPGAPRSPWNNQASSGYVSTGYGPNAGYGAGGWSAPGAGGAPGSGGAVPSQAGQSPGGPTAYGNQGYGYGGYGANEGYANPSNYGAGGRPSSTSNISSVGAGDQQWAVAGYMAGGYNDANGNPGYVNNAGWRTDPSQGGGYGTIQANGPSGGYGGGYGGTQSRQPQQQ